MVHLLFYQLPAINYNSQQLAQKLSLVDEHQKPHAKRALATTEYKCVTLLPDNDINVIVVVRLLL